jgi:hypothetical protein
MSSINVRSPYIVRYKGSVGQVVQVQLRMYAYTSSVPTLATITMSKTITSSAATTMNFNISPLIREHIQHINFVENAAIIEDMSASEWTRTNVKILANGVLKDDLTYDCFDGFSYRQEGYNVFRKNPYSMLEEGTYYTQIDSCGSLYFDTTGSGDEFLFEWRNIRTGALIGIDIFQDEVCKVPYVSPTAFAQGGNTLKVFNNETYPPELISSFTFIAECGGKYTPIDCDFVNRFGVWQRITFFKASRLSLKTSSKQYNLMSADLDYNTSIGSSHAINLNGRESIKVNTGLVGENYASAIRELLLSETILLGGDPVLVKTQAINLPNHENVKQINYSIEFEYAFDLINTLGI